MFKLAQTITLVTAFIAIANGFPIDTTPTTPLEALKRASENRCGDSSFINQSSGGSPWVDDCRVITHNIAGGGTWTTPTLAEHRELVRHASCRFGVRAVATGGAWDFTVGNQDIIDLINDSINRFQHEGRVGSKGNMHCGSTEVEWGLY